MAIPFALEPLPHQPAPLAVVPGSRALVPMAPATLVLPPGTPLETSPYLATPAPHFSESIISLRDIIGYLRDRGWLGFLAALPFAALTFWVLGMGAKVYEAEAKLRLRLQDTNVFNFSEMGRTGVTELSAPMLVNNHLTEIKSRKFVDYFFDRFPADKRDAVVDSARNSLGRKDQLLKMLGLYQPGIPAPAREVFATSLASAIRVEPQKESHILRIQVRHLDPAMAAEIANGYVNEYVRFYGEQEAAQTHSERDYLHKKAEELRLRLQESEAKLAEYRKSESLMQDSEVKDVEGERVRLLTNAISDADMRLVKARGDLKILRDAQQAGRDLLEVRIVADNPDVAFARKELDAKISDRKALEPLCGPRHPLMLALAAEIETRRATLDRAIGAVVAMTEAEVANQERQAGDYQKQLEAARGKALDQSGKNIQQNLLRDQVAMDREMFQKIMLRLNQADLTGQFKESNALSLSDIATPPEKPVKPNKPLAAVASLMIFGFVFLGLPVGLGLFDDHVLKTMRQGGSPSPHIPPAHTVAARFPSTPLQAPLLPAGPPLYAPEVLAASLPMPAPPPPVPQYQTSPFTAQPPPAPPPVPMAPPHMPLAVAASAPVLARLPIIAGADPETALGQLLQPEPHGAAGALQQITSTLEMKALNRSGLGGVILITSAEAGEGKTVAAAALAAAFCHQGRSVFMMECNAVAPALHRWFPHSNRHSSWAHDLESLRYGNTNLFLLPAHDLPAHATNDLLDGYRNWIDRARQQVDWIILDGAPVLRNFADTAPLAPLATDVLMVHHTRVGGQPQLRAALNLLQPMMSSSALRGLILVDG
jgi:uncharacterized protein involved in exopolysaccharide biosynthesis/Mrp family chromosome partitioning ATPase